MPATSAIQLVSRMQSVTGLPEDTVENVIHIGLESFAPDAGDITTWMTAFRDFYVTVGTGGVATPGSYLSESISRAANKCSILAYAITDLTGSTPMGSPIGSLTYSMVNAASGAAFPEEVAAVISYSADLTDVPITEPNPTPPPATIRPAQRRRGRLFFGPLQAQAGTDTGTQIRPASGFRIDIGVGLKKMANAINAVDSGAYFGVWSRADADVWEAVEGYVDDAWDTQRRRGLEATTRTTFTIP